MNKAKRGALKKRATLICNAERVKGIEDQRQKGTKREESVTAGSEKRVGREGNVRAREMGVRLEKRQ